MADPNLELEARRRALLLRLAEMETVERGEKAGKRKRDSADSDLALEMYLQEIEDSIALERDEAMSRSIAQAVGSDGDLVQGLLAEQDQNASVLNQDGPPRENANKDGTTAHSAAGDSATHEHMETRRCTACADSFAANRLAMCPCSHEYCYGCLSSLFMHATVDESLFPPRCCQQPIPVDDHVYALGSTLINRFKTKAVEFSTPNRTYCHDPNCATFVPPRFIRGRVATCGRCKAETCVSCKGASHDKDCPQDKSMHDMLLMAKENGWQRCYNCHRLVELGVGCNHMTCICRAQFCYVCGMLWKNCSCPVWNETNLYNRAEAIADRDAGNRGLQGARRAEAIRRAARDLAQNHACERHVWCCRPARRTCEECHQFMPNFIYECDICRVTVCRRCRLNRV